MKIILASKSPRRIDLLRLMGIEDFLISPAQSELEFNPEKMPYEAMCDIALGKAREIAAQYPEDLIIAADTLVFLDSAPLGKPKDKLQADAMLHELSGRQHQVKTGVAVICGKREISRCETTTVFFRDMTDLEIAEYIETGEPMDKAGAYGIQGKGAVFIPRIEGDYFNVMGLPLCLLHSMLNEIDICGRQR